MLKFIFKRFLSGLLVILGVIVVVFFLFHALPGDPSNMLPPSASPEMKESFKQELGLDKPLPLQFTYYLNDLSPLSFHKDSEENEQKYSYLKLFALGKTAVVIKVPYLRRSFISNRRVDELLIDGLTGTLILAIASMTFATLIGIIFGLIAAIKHNTFWDHFLVSISVLGISTPSFVAAVLFSMVFGFYLGEYTKLPIQGYIFEPNPLKEGLQVHLENLILPAITLGVRPLAIITQLTRSSMLDVLSQDYIRTAKAKGLKKYRILTKHALRNALNPVVTSVSGWLVSLIVGAFFIEFIFQWKGIGLKTIQAVNNLDLPIIMGSTLVVAAIFVFVNIFVDVIYAYLDPRVRLK